MEKKKHVKSVIPSYIPRIMIRLCTVNNLSCTVVSVISSLEPERYAQPECKARYRIPVAEPLYVRAKHYYLTRTNLLPAYMADWILLSKQASKFPSMSRKMLQIQFLEEYCGVGL